MARSKTAVRETAVSEHLSVTPIARKDSDGPVARWMRSLWRPVAALTYLLICVFDLLLHPIMCKHSHTI